MWKIITAVSCLLGAAGPAQVGEPKALTEKQLEKDLAVVQSYLARDVAKAEAELKAEDYKAADAAMGNVLKGIGGLPEGSPVCLQAIALARKYAAVSEYPDGILLEKRLGPSDTRPYHQAHARLYFAWAVLRKTKVLRDGMRLEELVGLLGQPTKVTSEYAEWYYRSPIHVNPSLWYFRVDKGGANRKKGSIEVH